ncbi:flagellar basal body P-ring formation protein FlgA [Bradyrhizobium lablabi]|uniref:flagellar basal body P-ring formation chaperone FlgA n=1 Tax=Bradyrhizobium lablabi TaxID=722472 RepID=UPI001BAB1BFE|nr:flagellar basal body P-ring formation chaperone FlgA [Bradyrhizobium lablabi]MBR1124309.1 flagellar basal body P-ring formation protein FlgA [Bradyrhizobium lablabi]
MIARSLLIAAALFTATSASAQTRDDILATPVLRANVTVASDLVRIGDVIDNAGAAGQIAIYRAPDLGTTGTLPVAQVLTALSAHQVIGVNTKGLREISVTRLARTLDGNEIQTAVARALERKNGLGEAANLSLTFDRDPGEIRLDAAHSGDLRPLAVRYDPRNNRFDVTLEIANEAGLAPAKFRFSGTAIETVEAAVLTRGIERNDIIKASDIVIERRPKAEVGHDAISRDSALGMQARRVLRAGQAIKSADLAKPDLVQREQAVTLIYETANIYLTIRGKALESGAEGDVVSVMNLQSKRTVTGVVIGRGQVAISVTPQRQTETSSLNAAPAAPVSVANAASQGAAKTE